MGPGLEDCRDGESPLKWTERMQRMYCPFLAMSFLLWTYAYYCIRLTLSARLYHGLLAFFLSSCPGLCEIVSHRLTAMTACLAHIHPALFAKRRFRVMLNEDGKRPCPGLSGRRRTCGGHVEPGEPLEAPTCHVGPSLAPHCSTSIHLGLTCSNNTLAVEQILRGCGGLKGQEHYQMTQNGFRQSRY